MFLSHTTRVAQLGIFLSIIGKLSPHHLPLARTTANTSTAATTKISRKSSQKARERKASGRMKERELLRILSRLYNCLVEHEGEKSFSISFFTLVLVWPELISGFSPEKNLLWFKLFPRVVLFLAFNTFMTHELRCTE